VDLTVDAYPYIAGSTTLHEMLPAWLHEGGMAEMPARLADPEVRRRLERELGRPELFAWEDILIVLIENPELKRYEMKRVSEIADDRGASPVEAVCDLLVEDNLGPRIVAFIGNESDVQNIMRHPAHMFCTDGLIYGDHVHPRSYGTYPRILGRYVRELGNLAWEEAIRKMTSFPARRFGLRGRGQIDVGFYADLVVLDPERILDTATFEHSNRYPEGIVAVVVNGAVVVKNGNLTGERPGRVLRRA
jgi:N-acyl-D-amino-acid deacylase